MLCKYHGPKGLKTDNLSDNPIACAVSLRFEHDIISFICRLLQRKLCQAKFSVRWGYVTDSKSDVKSCPNSYPWLLSPSLAGDIHFCYLDSVPELNSWEFSFCKISVTAYYKLGSSSGDTPANFRSTSGQLPVYNLSIDPRVIFICRSVLELLTVSSLPRRLNFAVRTFVDFGYFAFVVIFIKVWHLIISEMRAEPFYSVFIHELVLEHHMLQNWFRWSNLITKEKCVFDIYSDITVKYISKVKMSLGLTRNFYVRFFFVIRVKPIDALFKGIKSALRVRYSCSRDERF